MFSALPSSFSTVGSNPLNHKSTTIRHLQPSSPQQLRQQQPTTAKHTYLYLIQTRCLRLKTSFLHNILLSKPYTLRHPILYSYLTLIFPSLSSVVIPISIPINQAACYHESRVVRCFYRRFYLHPFIVRRYLFPAPNFLPSPLAWLLCATQDWTRDGEGHSDGSHISTVRCMRTESVAHITSVFTLASGISVNSCICFG